MNQVLAVGPEESSPADAVTQMKNTTAGVSTEMQAQTEALSQSS